MFNFNHKNSDLDKALGLDPKIVKVFKHGVHSYIGEKIKQRNYPDKKSVLLEEILIEFDPIRPEEYFLIGYEFGKYCLAYEKATMEMKKSSEKGDFGVSHRDGMEKLERLLRKLKRREDDED